MITKNGTLNNTSSNIHCSLHVVFCTRVSKVFGIRFSEASQTAPREGGGMGGGRRGDRGIGQGEWKKAEEAKETGREGGWKGGMMEGREMIFLCLYIPSLIIMTPHVESAPTKPIHHPEQQNRGPRFWKKSQIGPKTNSSHFAGSQIPEKVENRPGNKQFTLLDFSKNKNTPQKYGQIVPTTGGSILRHTKPSQVPYNPKNIFWAIPNDIPYYSHDSYIILYQWPSFCSPIGSP